MKTLFGYWCFYPLVGLESVGGKYNEKLSCAAAHTGMVSAMLLAFDLRMIPLRRQMQRLAGAIQSLFLPFLYYGVKINIVPFTFPFL